MEIKKYKELSKYTLKKEKSQLVLKNASIIMVQSGEIVEGDIAIADGYIVGVGNYSGEEEIDCKGKFVSPGFVDSHLHFESTMANPAELVHYASLHGTTTFIADPHEAANVSGIEGIEFMLEQTENSKADVYFMMPSCVPCIDNEDSGYILTSKDMEKIINNKRILGLGEVMDTKAVVNLKESMIDKLDLFKDKPIDGHGLGLNDDELSAYAMANVSTDHECSTFKSAMRELRKGIYIHIREGSAARNLKAIIEGIVKNKVDTSRFTFCTDDKHIEDIIEEGHISHNIRKAISLGLKPIEAYKMASYNPSICYNLKEIGFIAPGKKANLVILNDLEKVSVSDVIYNGNIIDRESKYDKNSKKINKRLLNTVNMDWFAKEMLNFKSINYAIKFVENEILTKKVDIRYDVNNYENKVVTIERHNYTGKYHVAKAVGFGLKNGAIASSVSHDSHNIIVIGDNDEDIMLAIEKIKEIQGGYVLVENHKVFDYVPLPVMGLMSDKSNDEIKDTLSSMISKAHSMGVKKGIEPFISLSFIALPVIPEIRITTNGLYDVINDKFLD